MQYLGHILKIKKLFGDRIKFQFNWPPCILSGKLDIGEEENKLRSHMTLVHIPDLPLTSCYLFNSLRITWNLKGFLQCQN